MDAASHSLGCGVRAEPLPPPAPPQMRDARCGYLTYLCCALRRRACFSQHRLQAPVSQAQGSGTTPLLLLQRGARSRAV